MIRDCARRLALVLTLAGTLLPSPTYASDAAATGIVAGLGITAASGKTTLAGGAGAIEASLLTAEALRQIGLGIRSLIDANVPSDAPIVLLSHTDTFDLSFARWLPIRMTQVLDQANAMVKGVGCENPKIVIEQPQSAHPSFLSDSATKKFGFAPTDITAAIMTDYGVSGITLTADDRALINAIQLGRNSSAAWTDLRPVIRGEAPPRPDHFSRRFYVPGETLDVDPTANETLKLLARLQSFADGHRGCTSAPWKAAIDTVDKFVASITASDKGAPPVIAAAALAPLLAGPQPHILRLTIEAVGGTAISRSNIWYALGYPGAVTISSGALVSFRLFDPGKGADELVGEIRCALKPTNLRDVRKTLVVDEHGTGMEGVKAPELTCGYRLG